MRTVTTALEGVLIIEPRAFTDARGFLFESYHAECYAAAGIPARFVQDNHSSSTPGTIRGLHYQFHNPQAKLVRVTRGSVFGVVVDIRRNSPTFGQWVGAVLSAQNRKQLYIPPGFAHGFCVPDEVSEVEYKCSAYYVAEDQHGVIWNDLAIGIQWPLDSPVLSEKDQGYAPLDMSRPDLPQYEAPAR